MILRIFLSLKVKRRASIIDSDPKSRAKAMTESLSYPPVSSFRALFDRVEALFDQAERALARQQFDLAEYFFQAAHNKDPENPLLFLQEAKLWHRYALISQDKIPYKQGYRAYKGCFKVPELHREAITRAIELKIGEFETFHTLPSLQDALRCFKKLPEKEHPPLLKAKTLQGQALFYKDPELFRQSVQLYQRSLDIAKLPSTAQSLANLYKAYFELTQNPAYLIDMLNYRKQALEIDPKNIAFLLELASDYKLFYEFTLDETFIEQFHETLSYTETLSPVHPELFIRWASGLVEMGSSSNQTKWVKLGIEKCHGAMALATQTQETDFIIAKGLSFLGASSDRLSPIYEALEKLKDYEEDPAHVDLTLTSYHVLMALFKYFQDLDYAYQAAERLQETLSFDSSLRSFWILMGKTYYEIALIDPAPQILELAARFYSKALEFYSCPQVLFLKAMTLSKLGEIRHNGGILEEALHYFEAALSMHKLLFQPKSLHLFHYAKTLDLKGHFHEEESYYVRALEILSQLLLLDPLFPDLHHQIALVQFHLGEFSGELEFIKKSLSHFKLAAMYKEEEAVYIDWAIACMALSEMTDIRHESVYMLHEAEHKLKKALKSGYVQGYYFMGCFKALIGEKEKALEFLKLAEKHEALPSPEDLLADEWLTSIRETDEFKKLVERQEMKKF